VEFFIAEKEKFEMNFDRNLPREMQWNISLDEDFDGTKKKILNILKEQKVSLSKTRTLFNSILDEIEDENPVTL